MTKQAQSTFEIKTWEEKPYDEFDGGRKLTRASVKKSFQGEIAGESTVEYLMMYREDGSADFIGLERVIGRLGNRVGSFVLEHRGTFEKGVATATWSVVHGSGTGDLRGLRGEGASAIEHGQEYTFALTYDFV
jgi:hypothetical protein